MRTRIGIFLFFSWIFLGILGYFYFFQISKHKNSYFENVKQLEKYNSHSVILEKLPQIFDREPTVAAIIVVNFQNKIIGSMYESARINLERFSTLYKNFDTIAQSGLKGYYRLDKVHFEDKGIDIFLVIKDNLSFEDQYKQYVFRYPNIRWILLFYFILGLAIILLIITQTIIQNKTRSFRIPVQKKFTHAEKKDIPQKNLTVIDSQMSNSHLLFDNQLKNVMSLLYNQKSYDKIIFYLFEENKWKPILMKIGSMYIRGEELNPIPEILKNFTNHNNWNNILRSTDSKEWLIPVKRKNILHGAFYIYFDGPQIPIESEIENIEKNYMNSIQKLSNSLFIQKTYEKAVKDKETNLYTYPYFYFMLKEKLLSSQSIAVLSFEIQNINKLSPSTIKKWTRRLNNSLLEDNLKSEANILISRLEKNRFAILFTLSETYTLDHAIEKMKIIQEDISFFLGSEIQAYGSLLASDKDIKSIDNYLNRLDASLRKAIKEKSFGVTNIQKLSSVM